MTDHITIGNCPTCNHFPTQHIGDPVTFKALRLGEMTTDPKDAAAVLASLLSDLPTGSTEAAARDLAIRLLRAGGGPVACSACGGSGFYTDYERERAPNGGRCIACYGTGKIANPSPAAAQPEQDAVGRFAIEVEKLLCDALGRSWSPGVSVDSLVGAVRERLAAQPERAGGDALALAAKWLEREAYHRAAAAEIGEKDADYWPQIGYADASKRCAHELLAALNAPPAADGTEEMNAREVRELLRELREDMNPEPRGDDHGHRLALALDYVLDNLHRLAPPAAAEIPYAGEWLTQTRSVATKEWQAGWNACRQYAAAPRQSDKAAADGKENNRG
jgi:hypothetical protein